MKNRTQLRSIFIQFRTMVELELGHQGLKILVIHCDNAREYKALGDLFEKDYSIKFEYTTPYTLEQNRVAKRLNRSLVTMARVMLLDAKLLAKF